MSTDNRHSFRVTFNRNESKPFFVALHYNGNHIVGEWCVEGRIENTKKRLVKNHLKIVAAEIKSKSKCAEHTGPYIPKSGITKRSLNALRALIIQVVELFKISKGQETAPQRIGPSSSENTRGK